MRHTKIVATVGPASGDPSTLDALIAAGVDIFRFNFSHGTHDSHAATLKHVREAAARARRFVGIIQDLSGPKMRTGRLAGATIVLCEGQLLRLAAGDFEGTLDRVAINAPRLISIARPDDRLLIDDGRLEVVVVAREGDDLVTRVVYGGPLGEHKGINAPGVALPVNALTPKDEADLEFGLASGVDFVAVSFVQSADDMRRVRAIVSKYAEAVPLIAKIERPQAVENIDSILEVSDAVIVARGDLGIELPLEQVPRVQKDITRRARARGIPVIIATQVLESMRTEPRPTRAEVSDAASAVADCVDAIMLAGETAVGAHPVRAVEMLAAIVREAEGAVPNASPPLHPNVAEGHGAALAEAAVTLAWASGANAIVAVTLFGQTAQVLASLRPRVPIYATTEREPVARRLSLLWGVVPLLVPIEDDVELGGAELAERLVRTGLLPQDATVVFVRVHPRLDRPDANFLRLQRMCTPAAS